jgi:eukaryotic-like serine/threonine-protein kinase
MKIPADQWPTVSRLLDEALDLDAGQRPAWLDALAQREPAVSALVQQLLAAHADRETADVLAAVPRLHLTAPLAAAAAQAASALAAGDRVGPYRLLRELGAGGMAQVWLARRDDGAFVREVALKIPQLSRLRRDLAQRFAQERDILARLEHPHIARFYDAGVAADGLPYLAMEYVDGQPITTWCDRQRLNSGAAYRAVPAGARRGAVRARQPRHPPRSEAVEHPRHRRRPGAAARLRHRPPAGRQ